MKKENIYIVIGAVIILGIAGMYSYSSLDIMSGEGTSTNPFQIKNWEHLDSIRQIPTAYYVLVNDLDSSTEGYEEYASSSASDGAGWLQIGTWSNGFSGTLDGKGHTIDGIYINRPETDNVGFIGITYGATIKNIGVTNANIICRRSAGILVGSACVVSGSTQGTTIENCFTTGTIESQNTSSTVRMGGLVGYLFDYSTIEDSWSSATVKETGGQRNGGLVGQIGGDLSLASAKNSFSYGLVETTVDSNRNGGFCGLTMPVSETMQNSQGCFWDTETSGKPVSSGGLPMTTAELKDIITFQNAGWDISSNLDKTWTIKSNSYPTLSVFETSSEPIQPTPGFELIILITAIVGLMLIRKRDW